ncbi:MAG: hypothetical protein WDA75_02585 [Candidatus Latescibacterota bacterium]
MPAWPGAGDRAESMTRSRGWPAFVAHGRCVDRQGCPWCGIRQGKVCC